MITIDYRSSFDPELYLTHRN